MATSATARRRAEHWFFSALALFGLVAVVAGFGHAYFFAGLVTAKLPTRLVHVHAAVLTGWIAVQTAQPLLVALRRVRWHRQLGLVGLVVAVAVPPLAILTAIGQVKRHAHSTDDLAEDFLFGVVAAVDFAVLAFFGLRSRVHGLSAHKRFMLLATLAILGPAIGRLSFVSSVAAFYCVFAAPIVLVIAFDLLTLRRIHRATLVGVAIIATSQALAEASLRAGVGRQLVMWLQAG